MKEEKTVSPGGEKTRLRIVWKHEGKPCRMRGCDAPMESQRLCGDKRVFQERILREKDKKAGFPGEGPQGVWKCSVGHDGWIWPRECVEVIQAPKKRAPGEANFPARRGKEEKRDMTTEKNTPASQEYITQVTSNIKSPDGKDWTTKLGPKTLIVGPNGSGKSARVNAIELALTKRVSDVAGRRTLAKPIELLTLAPGGPVKASCRLSGGASAICEVHPKEGGGAKTPSHLLPDGVDPETVLTIRPLTEAILGNPATARKFFLAQAETAIRDSDVVKRIRESRQQDYQQAMDKAPEGLGPVQKLLWIIELCKRRKSDLEGEHRAQEQYVSVAAGKESALPTDSQFDEVTKAIQAEESRIYDAAWKYWTERIAQADGNLHLLRDALRRIQSAGDNHEVVAAVRLILETSLRKALGVCPICESTVSTERLQVQFAAFQQYEQQMQTPTVPVSTAGPMTQVQIEDLIRQWEADRAFGVRWQAEAEQGLANLAPTDRLQELRLQLQRLEDAKRLWEGQQGAREKLSELGQQIARWTDLGMACESTVKSLLESSVGAFETRVQKLLPKGDAFRLQLDDNGRDVFRMGFGAPWGLKTALSGAEWARLMVALAGACQGDGLRVLIPEERAYDPETLQQILMALRDAKGQVILTSPVPPKGRKLKGWTYIDLGEKNPEGVSPEEDNGKAAEAAVIQEPLAVD